MRTSSNKTIDDILSTMFKYIYRDIYITQLIFFFLFNREELDEEIGVGKICGLSSELAKKKMFEDFQMGKYPMYRFVGW